MKYNPKVNEWAARLPGLAESHPLDPEALAQGSLELMWLLAELLKEISGFGAVSLQPAAGAHGELTGMLMARAYHRSSGEGEQRTKVLVPDSAHGTNPATATHGRLPDGHHPLQRARRDRPRGAARGARAGLGGADDHQPLDARHLRGPDRPGAWPPSSEAGAIAYMDGANLNAILGRFRPGEAGFDVMHFNLHKTFSTPHGGGGPGAGPVGRQRAPGAVPAASDAAPGRRRPGRGARQRPGRPLDAGRPVRARGRPAARASAGCARSTATSACSCAPIPTSAATATPGCGRSARTRCWPPTTCA